MTFTFTIDDSVAPQFNSAFCFITGGPSDPAQQAAWVKQKAVEWFQAQVKRGLGAQSQAQINAQVASTPVTVS
jgi:hypothetical protein